MQEYGIQARLPLPALLEALRTTEQVCGAVAVGSGAANGNMREVVMPGLRGASARVVPWALARAMGLLGYAARRPLRLGQTDEPSPDERVILNVIGALSRGDAEGATQAAEWLVKPAHNGALLRALQPVADAV